MKILTRLALSAAAVLAMACQSEPKVTIHADFEIEGNIFEVNEDIRVTNTSYAENGMITACKWEYASNVVWEMQPSKPFSFPAVGEQEIKLTAVVYTDKGNIEGSCIKTVTIQDTNKRPVADFDYSPKDEIIAGDLVTFTDKSHDPDGEIIEWEWTFGTTVVKEQNPTFAFTSYGPTEVSLKVTDNQKGIGKKTISINVIKSPYSLDLAWEQVFDENTAFCKFASPAVSVDGETVYAFSSGYNLVAFDKEGNQKWVFDANKHNPNAFQNNKTKNGSAATPAVDPATGNIYVVVGYNELDYKTALDKESGVYAVTPEGKEKWYFGFGNARYINVIPVAVKGYLFLVTKYNPEKANFPDMWASYGNLDNAHIIDKSTGEFSQPLQLKQGSYGGAAAFENSGLIFTHCNDAYGGRVFSPKAGQPGKWEYFGDAANQGSPKALGYGYETGASSYMAIDGTKVYILYASTYTAGSKVSTKSVLYCYDSAKYVADKETAYTPDWVVGINGANSRYYSNGVAVGEDGTIYVATSTDGDNAARITAVSPAGQVLWESLADGNVYGTPAIDDKGYVYYNDNTGKLVMLEPKTGKKLSEIQLANALRTSPTIGPDGTVYCLGEKNNNPTLFAVKGIATGVASSWSQLGGNPQKTCVK